MSTSATIIPINYRSCGLTTEPPQLRGLPTAAAVALEKESANCGGLGISRNCGGLAEIVDRQLSLRRVIATPCGTIFTQRNCTPMRHTATSVASVQPFIWRQSRLQISEQRSIVRIKSEARMARHPINIMCIGNHPVGIVIQIRKAFPFGQFQPNRNCGP